MKAKVYLHLGSNIDDREAYLDKAIQLIKERLGEVITISSLYETEAWGIKEQANFLNQALLVHSTLEASELLDEILKIEKEIGRKRSTKWTARCIDIDILFYNNLIINTPHLILPHPHIHKRNFVLIPLLEIAADYMHPILKEPIEQLYWSSKDECEVYLYELTT